MLTATGSAERSPVGKTRMEVAGAVNLRPCPPASPIPPGPGNRCARGAPVRGLARGTVRPARPLRRPRDATLHPLRKAFR